MEEWCQRPPTPNVAQTETSILHSQANPSLLSRVSVAERELRNRSRSTTTAVSREPNLDAGASLGEASELSGFFCLLPSCVIELCQSEIRALRYRAIRRADNRVFYLTTSELVVLTEVF